MEIPFVKPKITKDQFMVMAGCLSIALYFVVFLWGIWDRGVFALGLNAFVFWAALLVLFIRTLYPEKKLKRSDLAWILPLGLIALSYFLYSNPFIKAVNLPVYPLLVALFLNYGLIKNKKERHWDSRFFMRFAGRILSILSKLQEAGSAYITMFFPQSRTGRGLARKIVLGAVLFLVIALTIVIPLLSSADTLFAARMDFIYEWLDTFVSETLIAKAVVFILLAVGLYAALLAWRREFDYTEAGNGEKRIDAVVAGIVLGGLLGIYLLFLSVQVERLFLGSLPFDFKETETLVKSGFWQLFFLSGLNILIYLFTYRKTSAPVQKLLTVFTAASLLLLASAGYRMVLYAVNYGLSYEKFFASYTVLYIAILFIWLIARSFVAGRANILKFVAFLFLWMYALVAVLPIEQAIFRANLALAQRPDSRINLYELTMLSSDVLNLARTKQAEGLLVSRTRNRETGEYGLEQSDWGPWIERQEKRLADKKWYEHSLTDFFNQP